MKPDAASDQTSALSVTRRADLSPGFHTYLHGIVREWLQVLLVIGGILIPLFWVLDYFSQPPQLHVRFALYRGVTTALIFLQWLVVNLTRSGRLGVIHGYIFGFVVGLMIAQMTVDLGGLNSSYYAGLNLVIMAVNMLLSWKPIHSIANGIMILALYVGLNLVLPQPFDGRILLNNIYFLSSTVVVTVAISWVRYNLVCSEFLLRAQLVASNESLELSRAEVLKARDNLWGEMQITRHIQQAMLPDISRLTHYEVEAIMSSAIDVGGDYYDVVQTDPRAPWIAIGDVSGHGVDAGLMMMMTQTSIRSILNQNASLQPSAVLDQANRVLRENISKLGVDRYMTIVLFRLGPNSITFAGKHTDFLMYHAGLRSVETVETHGSWLGIVDDLGTHLQDRTIPVRPGDIVLLYTDGVVEAENASKEQFGEARLKNLLSQNAHRPIKDIGAMIFGELMLFQSEQQDDISLVLFKCLG